MQASVESKEKEEEEEPLPDHSFVEDSSEEHEELYKKVLKLAQKPKFKSNS